MSIHRGFGVESGWFTCNAQAIHHMTVRGRTLQKGNVRMFAGNNNCVNHIKRRRRKEAVAVDPRTNQRLNWMCSGGRCGCSRSENSWLAQLAPVFARRVQTFTLRSIACRESQRPCVASDWSPSQLTTRNCARNNRYLE